MKISKYNNFDELPAIYVDLFTEAEKQSLFYGIDWFRNLERTTLGERQALAVVAAEDEMERPRVAMIFRKEEFSARNFEARRISSFSNFYSMAYAPIVAKDEASPVDCMAQLIKSIMNDLPRFDTMRLGPFDIDSPFFEQTKNALEQAGLKYRPFFSCGNWFEPVADISFDDYLKSRPSQIRNTFKRRRNKLEKTGRARYVLTTGREGLEEAIAAYNRVYSTSWKEPEQFPEFMPGLIRLCADKGLLRLGVVYMDDIPAAAQVWLIDGNKAVIYKLAYDEAFKEHSIGTILTMNLMKHVIDIDGVSEVDYGSGDDPYKKGWMSHRRERWGLIAHNPRTVHGWVRSISERAGKSFSRLRRNAPIPESSTT